VYAEWIKSQGGKMRSSKKDVMAFCAAMVMVLLLSGCGTGSTSIIKPVSRIENSDYSIMVNSVSSADAKVSQEMLQKIKQMLVQKLKSSNAFNAVSMQQGTITINVNIVTFDEGSQAGRWLAGGIGEMGKGEIVLETTFIDSRSKNEIGKIRTHGDVVGGFLGGSIDSAYSNALSEVVSFAAKNFGNK